MFDKLAKNRLAYLIQDFNYLSNDSQKIIKQKFRNQRFGSDRKKESSHFFGFLDNKISYMDFEVADNFVVNGDTPKSVLLKLWIGLNKRNDHDSMSALKEMTWYGTGRIKSDYRSLSFKYFKAMILYKFELVSPELIQTYFKCVLDSPQAFIEKSIEFDKVSVFKVLEIRDLDLMNYAHAALALKAKNILNYLKEKLTQDQINELDLLEKNLS